MATFKTTKKDYPNKWADGKTYYNVLNVRSQDIISQFDNSILNDSFHLVEFYTEKQTRYYNGTATYVWTKTPLRDTVVAKIIQSCLPCVEHFACITHDRDKNDDGSPKSPHTHLLLKFVRGERVASRLLEYLHIDSWDDAQYKIGESKDYLTHNSEACRKAGKCFYNVDDVITDDWAYWSQFEAGERLQDNAMAIVEDILSGLSLRELGNKYQREIIINYDRYRSYAMGIHNEECPQLVRDYSLELYGSQKEYVAFYDKYTGDLVQVRRCRDNGVIGDLGGSEELC